MCGICGALMERGKPDQDAIGRAMEMMRSRGPDEQGRWADGRAGFGHVRLSIIDLAQGQQPMHSRDKRYCLVFNGEIYNFQALRESLIQDDAHLATRSDSEVIIELYRRHGSACVNHLRGMFAFALYDRENGELFLARDRMGVKPLIYARTSRGFFFASTIPALLALAPELRNHADPHGLAQFFAQLNVPAPRTAYRDACKLQPGHVLKLDRHGKGEPRRYWFPERIEPLAIDQRDAVAELRRRVDDAVGSRLISERPVGAFLSGGVDSAIVVSSMSRLMNSPVRTFTVGFEERSLDERHSARQLANHLGTDHHELTIRFDTNLAERVEALWEQFGEPFADHSLLPSAAVACAAAEDLTVVLTGDGPDEFWGGYKRHRHAVQLARIDRFHLRPVWLGARRLGAALQRLRGRDKHLPLNQLDRLIMNGQDSRALNLRMNAIERTELLAPESLSACGAGADYPSTLPANEHWDDMTTFSWFDAQTYQQGVVIPKLDTASMSCSLEARSPFLDQQIIEWTLSLPGALKLHPRLGSKYLLKRAFERDVPRGYFDQKKRYFSPPTTGWLRNELRDWLEELLLGEAGRHLFREQQVRKLLAEHDSGRDNTASLWSAASFSYWVQHSGVSL